MQKDVVPASNYMFKVNNRNTRSRCEICSKLTIKTAGQRQWRTSGAFIVNFEQANADWGCGVFIVNLIIFHTFF